MIFTRFARTSRPASTLAIAIALATGAAVGVTALETPAFAQKKKKEKSAEKDYSEAFLGVYQPIATQAEEEAADWTTLAGQVPTVVAAVQTEDDRMVAGNFVYTAGQKTQNPTLQLQGVELMLESGKVPAENLGQYNTLAGQLAYNEQQYSKARNYLMKAVELGYTEAQPEGLIAESYFNDGQYEQGLTYLSEQIAAREAAGGEIDEQWLRRGLQAAYDNKLANHVADYGAALVKYYPTEQSWSDVITITAYGNGWQNPEILDIMRLAREAGALRDERMYADYIESADYRKLPGEVMAVIDEGVADGTLQQSDTYVTEIRGMAVDRAAADRSDMAGILQSAQSSSDLNSVMSGADLALSYGDYAAAEMLYTKALGMPGVNTAMAQTRLGIAQLEQGKAAEAKASFEAVEGQRAAIANLWAVYADQQQGTM